MRPTQHGRANRLSREFLTPLAAASGKNGATRTRTHAQTEAVGLCSTPVVRLKRTLAHGKLLAIQTVRQCRHEKATHQDTSQTTCESNRAQFSTGTRP